MTADGKLNINQNRQGGQEVREAEGGGHAPKHVARGKVEGLGILGPEPPATVTCQQKC